MDKTVHRVISLEEQEAESYRHWQSLSVGERLSAVWDASEAAYAFAAAFKGVSAHDVERHEATLESAEHSRS